LASRTIVSRKAASNVWHHIFLDRYPDPLGYGYGQSRFSDLRKNPKPRFGVYYVGATLPAGISAVIRRADASGWTDFATLLCERAGCDVRRGGEHLIDLTALQCANRPPAA
jgi:hypothetical protein